MVEIRRAFYLERLHRFVDTPAIVVVTGLRRVGKSILLRQFADEVRATADVVYVDKESMEFEAIRSARDLIEYIESETAKGTPRIVIVDEVQQIENWQRAVASLLGSARTQVLISGSNASLLSGELATRIAGRYITFRIFPLDLREFRELYRLRENTDIADEELFELYLHLGGLPGVLHTDLSELVVNQMLRDVFNTIALRDIVTRHQIRNVRLLEDVVLFVMDNIGSLISAKRISDFLKTQRRSISVDTVINYLSHLQEAFLCDIVNRYDIKGRRRMEVNNKLYLGDIGLRNGLLGYREHDISGMLENLVYLELRRRGFSVSVGSLGNREIDFVAETESGRFYIQVAYLLPDENVIKREFGNLLSIKDNYEKLVVTLDDMKLGTIDGIKHVNAWEL